MNEIQSVCDALKDVRNPSTMLVLALSVGALVRVLKSKKVGDILDAIPLSFVKRIPKAWLPWLSVGIGGALTMLDAKLNAGLAWGPAMQVALMGAVLSGGAAVGGHETIAKLFSKTASADDGRAAPPKDNEPTRPGGLSLRAALLGAAVTWCVLGLSGCDLLRSSAAKTAKDVVLTAADIACVEDSPLMTAEETAAACGILMNPFVRELLDNLIGQREAARRAGFVWKRKDVVETVTTKDAGRD
jgi:hypothetical protein